MALETANIIMNANTVPFDTVSPMNPSGLRMGTPAITTRGMKEKEMKKIAGWIHEVISNYENKKIVAKIGKEVKRFASLYPAG